MKQRTRIGRRCQALNGAGMQCRRKATRRYRYHGDGELYGAFHDPWPSWVVIWLCEGHRRDEPEPPKGELNEAKEEVRRQVEMRMLDQGRHHVDLQEASGQIAPESLCSCGETLRELEAALVQAERERDEARAERNARAKRRTLEGRNG